MELAQEMDGADFSFEQFRSDWNQGLGRNPFREDLRKAKLNGIGRYPSLTFLNNDGKGIIIVGYRPYDALVQAYEHARNI